MTWQQENQKYWDEHNADYPFQAEQTESITAGSILLARWSKMRTSFCSKRMSSGFVSTMMPLRRGPQRARTTRSIWQTALTAVRSKIRTRVAA